MFSEELVAAEMDISKLCVAECPDASVTSIAKVYWPATEGFPEITPLAAVSVRPGGKAAEPDANPQV
jgi:hypothetical protein